MNIIYLEKIDSTNSYAKLNIEKFEDRTVISASSQTSGRGRFKRKWIDLGEGNLFVSLILKPSCTFLPLYANLTQFTAVVLCRVLEEYGVEPEIKWPNDILISGKKIAGILSEVVMSGNNLKGLVIGAGVNLNADKSKLVMIIDKAVTSLNIELEREYEDKNLFLEKFLHEFFKSYDKFLENGFTGIKDEYVKRCNFLGRHICVNLLNEHVEGIALSLNDSGELILRQHGKDIILTAGDIL